MLGHAGQRHAIAQHPDQVRDQRGQAAAVFVVGLGLNAPHQIVDCLAEALGKSGRLVVAQRGLNQRLHPGADEEVADRLIEVDLVECTPHLDRGVDDQHLALLGFFQCTLGARHRIGVARAQVGKKGLELGAQLLENLEVLFETLQHGLDDAVDLRKEAIVLVAVRLPAGGRNRDAVDQASRGVAIGGEEIGVDQCRLEHRELQARQQRLDLAWQRRVLQHVIEHQADDLDRQLVDRARGRVDQMLAPGRGIALLRAGERRPGQPFEAELLQVAHGSQQAFLRRTGGREAGGRHGAGDIGLQPCHQLVQNIAGRCLRRIDAWTREATTTQPAARRIAWRSPRRSPGAGFGPTPCCVAVRAGTRSNRSCKSAVRATVPARTAQGNRRRAAIGRRRVRRCRTLFRLLLGLRRTLGGLTRGDVSPDSGGIEAMALEVIQNGQLDHADLVGQRLFAHANEQRPTLVGQ